MNSEFPPPNSREELEASITAMLLGELPSDKAFALGRAIEQDKQLAQTYAQLKKTIGLIETASKNEPAADAAIAPPKLSEQRRKELLQRFKTVAPREFDQPARNRSRWILEVAVVVCLLALITSLLLPTLGSVKRKSRSMAARSDSSHFFSSAPEPSSTVNRGTTDAQEIARENAISERHEVSLLRPKAASADAKMPTGAKDGDIQQSDTATKAGRIVLPSGTDTEVAQNGRTAGGLDLGYQNSTWKLESQNRGFYYDTSGAAPKSQVFLPQAPEATVRYATRTPDKSSFGEAELLGTLDKSAASGVAQTPALVQQLDRSGGGGLGGGGGTGGTPAAPPVVTPPAEGAMTASIAAAVQPPVAASEPAAVAVAPPASLAFSAPIQSSGVVAPAKPAEDEMFRRRYGLARSAIPVPAEKEANLRLAEEAKPALQPEMAAAAPATSSIADGVEPLGVDPTTGLPVAVASAADDVVSFNKKIVPVQQQNLYAFGDNFQKQLGDTPTPARSPVPTTEFYSGITRGDAAKMPVQDFDSLAEVRAKADQNAAQVPPGDALSIGGDWRFAGSGRITNGTAVTPNFGQMGRSANSALLADSLIPTDQSRGLAGGRTQIALPNTSELLGLADTEATRLRNRILSESKEREIREKTQLAEVGRYKDSLGKRVEAEKQISDLALNSPAKEPGQSGRKSETLARREQSAKATENTPAKKTGSPLEGKQLALAQAYEQKKTALEELQAARRIINMRTASEKVDTELPKTSMVQLTQKAAAGDSGLWERVKRSVGGGVERSAVIKLERDQTDTSGIMGERGASGVYDPYFVQSEFEVVLSDKVLGKALEKLKSGANKTGRGESIESLRKKLDLRSVKDTSLVSVGAKSSNPEEAAKIANAVAEAYQDYRLETKRTLSSAGIDALKREFTERDSKIREAQRQLDELGRKLAEFKKDSPLPKTNAASPIPQPEIATTDNAFSTFSLNVSDVSFKLAAASLEKGVMPDPAGIRSEEFINAFDYRDPEPAPGAPFAFAFDRSQYPFALNRDLLRFSLKTASVGRQPGRPLNIVLLLDNSGSMERADRQQIIHEALRVLATQLQPQDKFSVITFARTAQLRVDGISGDKASQTTEQLSGLTPEGGTNLEDAMKLAYEVAHKYYSEAGINRVVLLTDGAANLGDVNPDSLKQKVETQRKQGIALDCFGIGWEGFNDDLLEVLSRNGDGRYGFVNTPEQAATEFAGQLAGALQIAASDVKVQVEFNPARVSAYRQVGYAKHQLTKEQFRDNTVDAAELGSAESGNAIYITEVKPNGTGPLATVRVRYKVPGTQEYKEHEWTVPYSGNAAPLDQAAPAMRLAASASAFSEWLAGSPFATEVSLSRLVQLLNGVPATYGADSRPQKLEWMIRQAQSLAGK